MADKEITLEEVNAEMATGKPLSEAASKYLQKAINSGPTKYLDSNEFMNLLSNAREYAYKTPGGKEYFQDLLRDKKSSAFARRNAPFFKSILAGADLATSLSQISKSNAAIRKLVQPGIPTSPGLPPELNGQINQAQVGGFQAARALAPAQLENAQAFQGQVNNAKSVSGGNAANFTSQYNAATLQRQRAAAAYPAIQDAIRARQQDRADKLIGLKGELGQQDYHNRLSASQMALEQYNLNSQAAGQLGAQGRINLRNTLGQIPDIAAGIAGQSYNPSGQNVSPVSQTPGAAQSSVPFHHPYYDSGHMAFDSLDDLVTHTTATTGYPQYDALNRQATWNLMGQRKR